MTSQRIPELSSYADTVPRVFLIPSLIEMIENTGYVFIELLERSMN